MEGGSSKDVINGALDFLTIVFEKTDNRMCLIVGDLSPKLLNLALTKEVYGEVVMKVIFYLVIFDSSGLKDFDSFLSFTFFYFIR